MGWKAFKEHYGIEYIVQVCDGSVIIGSAYVSEIIRIDETGRALWTTSMSQRPGDNLDRYMQAINADPSVSLALLWQPDTFSAFIPVWTYRGSEIVEEQCEEPGWPNITHAGNMMYENTYFATRDDAIKAAIQDAKAGFYWRHRRVREIEDELKEAVERRDQSRLVMHDLLTAYPEIAASINDEDGEMT